ncbi:hypothetical protein RB601_005120 [Gaeumannomyces tritici]
MENSLRRHFFHHGGQDPAVTDRSREVRKCHWCQLRSFEKHALYPISIVNDTDDLQTLPQKFKFISENHLGPGVSRAEASFRSGCECANPQDCMKGGCQCLEEVDDEVSDSDDYEDGKGSGASEKTLFSYYSTGPKAGLLKKSRLQSRQPIYECHEGCSCGPDCPNRVVERGRMVPLQIFRTDDRGWGVRSVIDIKCGQFVDTYLGEVITSDEADRRRNEATNARKKDIYLFGLDKFIDENSPDPRLTGPPLEVDGEDMSGPSRFINHSCDPNMRIFARVGDHADKHMHDLALFAIRDIPKGEELTFDYVDGVDIDKASKTDGHTKCLCGSNKCRGWLW